MKHIEVILIWVAILLFYASAFTQNEFLGAFSLFLCFIGWLIQAPQKDEE